MHRMVDSYLRERQGLGHITAKTASDRRAQLILMIDSLPTDDPNQVTVQMLRAWTMTSASGLPMKPRTVALRTTIAKHFWQWCADNDLIDKSPARLLETPKIRDADPRFFETDEVRRLCSVVKNQRDLVIVLFMVQMGLRRVEIARANLVDVDLQGARMGVRGKGYDGDVSRTVPIPAEAAMALHRYLHDRPYGVPLFLTKHGERMKATFISHIVSDYMRKAGIKQSSGDGKSAHALRHTFAQQLVDNDVNLRVIQAAMGHGQVTTTERYMRRKVDVMATALEGRSYLTGGEAA